jgi:hypothetical protein
MLRLPFSRFFAGLRKNIASYLGRAKKGSSLKKRLAHRWGFEQLETRLVPSTLTTDKPA